jgi:uncharacterized membrane protein
VTAAALYSAGITTTFPALSGFSSYAVGINSSGQIAGDLYPNRAVIWSGGTITDLGSLSDWNQSTAAAINDAGQVTGQSAVHFGTYGAIGHVFLYTGGI